jgi:hypothetical protein
MSHRHTRPSRIKDFTHVRDVVDEILDEITNLMGQRAVMGRKRAQRPQSSLDGRQYREAGA